MAWNVQNENEAYVGLLMPHLGSMVARLRQIPPAQWDYAPAPPAPTPRILATHTFQWLVCDRQHITDADAATHPRVPEVPPDPALVCDMLEAEAGRWKALLLALTPEEFDAPRSQFNQFEMNVRAFVCHIIQNSIYKSGQLATLFFALGLDGTAPYEAPFPNPIYDDVFGPAVD